MLRTLLLVIVGFYFSVFIVDASQNHQRTRMRLRHAAMSIPVMRVSQSTLTDVSDRYYLEGVGYLVGDISCQFNARSGYIRCAVNPSGPCEGCRFYEAREFNDGEKVLVVSSCWLAVSG
ncbi:MAG: hypothetical protein HC908_11935 [Calothrix sp. SM1_7_51]|nr:hypothetical protein [Calothrix sp. SM1_7_51]